MSRTARIIVLSEPITNPNPDGRKRNWTGEKTFQPGRYIDDGSCIFMRGKSRYDRLDAYRSKEAMEAIRASAQEVAPHGIRELMLTLGGEDDAELVLGLLLAQGDVTAEQISKAVHDLNNSDHLFETV